MKAKLAYLTTPSPGVFVLNIQPEGEDDIRRFEITKAHLVNIILDGAALSLRENRVPVTISPNESAHERAGTAGA